MRLSLLSLPLRLLHNFEVLPWAVDFDLLTTLFALRTNRHFIPCSRSHGSALIFASVVSEEDEISELAALRSTTRRRGALPMVKYNSTPHRATEALSEGRRLW